MTIPVNTSFDFQALAALKSEAKAQSPEALKEAAKQFESLFTRMLLKSMREANKSFGDSLFGSEQADFYQDMFDDQISMHLSQGRGLGLADMLIRQLAGSSASVQTPGSSAGAAAETTAARRLESATSAREPIASSKADFVRRFLPHAERAAREVGVDPQALLAQAALETGWGRSVPCTSSGSCSFNMFGIKAGSRWTGATVNVPTLEFEEGVAVRKVERFRAYDSPAASFRDYAKLLRGSSRYESALGAGADVASFATALQRGGYATDPDYSRKIVAVAAEVRKLVAADALKSNVAGSLTGHGGVRS